MPTREGSTDILAPIRASVVRYFAWLAGGAVLVLLASSPFRDEPPIIIASYLALLAIFSLAYVVRLKRPLLAGALCSLGPLLLVTVMVSARGGISNPAAVVSYVTLVLVTGLTWNATGTLVVALLSSVALGWFVFEAPGTLPFNRLQQWAELVIQLAIVSGIVRLTLGALNRSHQYALAQEGRFKMALEGSSDAIIGLNSAGEISIFNRGACLLSGLTENDALGRTPGQLGWLSEEALRRLSPLLLPDSVAHSSAELPEQDGKTLEISLISDALEKDLRLLAIRDISDKKREVEARRALEQRLAHSKSLDALGRLAGGVAHDFNNLLTVVTGTTELISLDSSLPASVRKDLKQIEDAAERAARLTSQLLSFGRKQVLEPRTLSLNDSLRELTPLLERLLPSHVDLRIVTASDLDPIQVDEARLEQVIVNLVSNANDAMPEGGTLTLATRNVAGEEILASDIAPKRLENSVLLRVTDTGTGFDAETRACLFEPFFTTKGLGDGTGLGLATVQGIIAQSGGHIAVESKEGFGSSFFIYFPPADAPLTATHETPASDKSPPRTKSQGKILLVEDQLAVRLATERLLEELGYEVDTAENGEDALEKYRDQIQEYSHLVTDVVMPKMNGPALSKELQALHPTLKVLFVSGYAEHELSESGALSAGRAYLAKPFTQKSLAAKLSSL